MPTPDGEKNAADVKTYYCGYCVNHLHRMFRDTTRETRHFPAAAVLFLHGGSYYLFDTGYSDRIFECAWHSKVYNRFNPVICDSQDSLKEQLSHDGIEPADIEGIILSHLHPDHIGGLMDFPNSRIIMSKGTYHTLQHPRLLDFIFMDLIPSDIESRIEILDFNEEYDLFCDGSVILKDVSGHTRGQMGMFLSEYNTFYAADSCWGVDLLDKQLSFASRLLQRDLKEYQKTIEIIKDMRAKGISIIPSHEVRA